MAADGSGPGDAREGELQEDESPRRLYGQPPGPPLRPVCEDGICMAAAADGDASGCLDAGEANELLGTVGATTGWATRVRSIECCWDTGVVCMDFWQAEELVRCVYAVVKWLHFCTGECKYVRTSYDHPPRDRPRVAAHRLSGGPEREAEQAGAGDEDESWLSTDARRSCTQPANDESAPLARAAAAPQRGLGRVDADC